MKKLIIVLLSWLSVAAQAQTPLPPQRASYSQKYLMPKKGVLNTSKASLPNAMRTMQPNTTMVRVDSVIRMDSIYSDVTHRYELFEYNNQGHLLKDSMFYRSNALPRVLESKNEYEYDQSGRLISKREYDNNVNYSIVALKNTINYYYDANGLLLETNEVAASGSAIKETYTYDANNRLIEYGVQEKQSSTSDWVYRQKKMYNYDAAGRSNEVEYFMASDSTPLYLVAKDIVYYNAANKIDSIVYKYVNSTGTWVNLRKDVYSYDANGNTSLRKIFNYDTTFNTWTENIKQYYQCNLNYLMSNVLLQYNASPLTEEHFFTNPFTHLDVYRFEPTSNTWKFNNLYDYYYSPMEVTAAKTEINSQASMYPNPTPRYLNIQLSGSNGGEVSLYDAQGRKVLTQNMTATQNMLDLQALPQGMYWYRVQTADAKIQTGKVVKQ